MVYILIFCLMIVLIVLEILVVMDRYGQEYILDMKDLPIDCDTVIVLGAGLKPNGDPCDILVDRLDTGAKVYVRRMSKTILLTGENSGQSYNELKAMKNWIMNNYTEVNVKEQDLLIDNCGFCTFDSIYRAKTIFNIKSAIISTNRYHLPRAIYIARRLGIDAYGIASDVREYDRMKKYKRRELLAQIKDFFLCLIKMH
ncbi:ElyC/SanA/YdcF family protein [Clostridium sp.]|uniref:SanA/YdcF family protein n=1 Tax=Clostridium sp. TaxID=1506 RepID=UPI002615C7C2|nr:ElyC/SanA/YdcF family protein [Clostridium sp.]